MDEGRLATLILLGVLVLLHGLITLATSALSVSPTAFLRDSAEEGNRRAVRVMRMNENLPRLYISAQVVLTLIRAAFFVIAADQVRVTITDLPDPISDQLIPFFSYAAVIVPLALLFYLLGDLLPHTIGTHRAEQIAPMVALPMRGLVLLFAIIGQPLTSIEKAVARVAGSDIPKSVTDEEIITLVDVGHTSGSIEDEEKEMIRSVLEFGDTLVREIMIPRPDVVALEMDATLQEALDLILSSGHSRIPVYENRIDNVKGVFYAKDLLGQIGKGELKDRTVRELIRTAYFVPETKAADLLFREMQKSKVHLALLVDEYGGMAGLITIEDLVEEIVGDIQDEYDMNEEVDYVELGQDEYIVDASMNLDDFNSMLEIELSTEDNDTLGGFIFSQLGRVPEIGEILNVEGIELRVDSIEGRRIRKVHVTRLEEEPPVEDPKGKKDSKPTREPTDEIKSPEPGKQDA